MKSTFTAIAIIVISVIVVGIPLIGIYYVERLQVPVTSKSLPIVEVIPRIKAGVVYIKCPAWQGSGFVIGPNLIMTARHCVEGVEDFEIITDDEHKLHATRALSSSSYDIGFIYIDDLTCVTDSCERDGVLLGEHKVELHPLKLGSIAECQLGERMLVIGSPYGKKHFNAVTCGILSMGTMQVENFDVSKNSGWSILFMSDAATWGGSSGSPVITLDGTVVGVLVSGHGREENTSYCVPVGVILDDIEVVKLMFIQDKYYFEEKSEQTDPYYNYLDNTEYYRK